MLGKLDHVGYLTNDLEGAIAQSQSVLGLTLVRRFERKQFSLVGAYLGPGEGSVELFTFSDPELLKARLGEARLRLDHVAYDVEDIAATAAALRSAGVCFTGPDLRGGLHEPVELGGVLHLWTLPHTSCGHSIQLMQR